MNWFEQENAWLAPYAMHSADSRGRRHAEPEHPFRTVFQRDRERLVHSSSFRRLVGKTQVLVGRINDHHRTRLTHTLEVAQIGRTVARRLRLNEDLVEAIALSHDIGHPPFGHAGERTLAACMKDYGGFEHNLFGLRRVETLEDRYPGFPGLNLSWELREAFVQHCKNREAPECAEFLAAGGPLLEAQLADTVDSLAYDTHDIDDALGIDLIRMDDLAKVPFWSRGVEMARARHAGLHAGEFRAAVIRELIAWQVSDLIAETEKRLAEEGVATVADVRAAKTPLVDFSREVNELKVGLEGFLLERVYQHHRVKRMARKGQRILDAMFAEFLRHPDLLPAEILGRWSGAPRRASGSRPRKYSVDSLERVVCDHLAGMTDHYAKREHLRLFHPDADQ